MTTGNDPRRRHRAVARGSGDEVFPATVRARNYWVTWILDGKGRKRPVAPWLNGHAYPTKWKGSLPDDERPETDFESATRWTDFTLTELGMALPDDAKSNDLKRGIILPKDRPPRERRITVIDWDDVRDPETGEIHPVAAHYIETYGGYVEISRSGTGLHQFVLGGFQTARQKLIATIDDAVWVGGSVDDDLPQVEVYDGGRHVAMTGRHVEGTDRDLVDGQLCIDSLVEQYRQNELEDGHRATIPTTTGSKTDGTTTATKRGNTSGGDRGDSNSPDAEVTVTIPSADDYNGPSLAALRKTCPDDRTLGYHAIVAAFCADPADHNPRVLNWKLEGAAAANGYADGLTMDQIVADLRGEYLDGASVGFDQKTSRRVKRDYERAQQGELAPHSWHRLASWGVLPPSVAANDAETVAPSGSGVPAPGGHLVHECPAPDMDAQRCDVDAIRAAMRNERYDEYINDHGVCIYGDEAGTGKSTNAALAAAERGRPHIYLCERHEKAREFANDPVTPDGYLHLRGGEQMKYDVCMDAEHDDNTDKCPKHGHFSECPRMCPVFGLSDDNEIRQLYEQLAEAFGSQAAHLILAKRLPDHDDGRCAWLDQFDDIADAERIVGVHNYQTLKSVKTVAGGPNRDVLVDELPGFDASGRDLTVRELVAFANALDDVGSVPGHSDLLVALADATREIIDVLTGSNKTADSLTDLDLSFLHDYIDDETIPIDLDSVSDADLPSAYTTDDIERTMKREYVGMPGEGYRKVEQHAIIRPGVASALTEAKIEYNETLRARLQRDDGADYDGEPFAFDALLIALADTGFHPTQVRQAISTPDFLTACPICHGSLDDVNGDRICAGHDGDSCGWRESDGIRVDPAIESTRTDAMLVTGGDAEHGDYDGPSLSTRQLPLTSDLPDNPLVLDATAAPIPTALYYGYRPEDVTVLGDTDYQLDGLHAAQIIDGQFHGSTLLADGSRGLARAIDTIEQASTVHDRVLVVGKQAVLTTLHNEYADRLPDNITTTHYHALRGMNYTDHDAVVVVGAPHPAVDGPDGLRRTARLLAQGDHADTIRVGGIEHSTRGGTYSDGSGDGDGSRYNGNNDCLPREPVYRKLRYTDNAGRGRAVPTKEYTGLVGDLFYAHREAELEQAVHRIRPILADTATDGGPTTFAYLLTNVPTHLPISEVTTLDELTKPVTALLPVADGALRLAYALSDLAERGDTVAPDGFRATSFVERDATGSNSLQFKKKQVWRFARQHVAHLPDDISHRTINDWVNQLTDLGILDESEYEYREGRSYTAESRTLKRALLVLTNNVDFQVRQKRILAALVERCGSTAEWLRQAESVMNLHGNRCEVSLPPPDENGGLTGPSSV